MASTHVGLYKDPLSLVTLTQSREKDTSARPPSPGHRGVSTVPGQVRGLARG